jgi:hypothetical protein
MHKILRNHAENQLKNDFNVRLGRNAFAPPCIDHVIEAWMSGTINAASRGRIRLHLLEK